MFPPMFVASTVQQSIPEEAAPHFFNYIPLLFNFAPRIRYSIAYSFSLYLTLGAVVLSEIKGFSCFLLALSEK